jgi:hypothetical protein
VAKAFGPINTFSTTLHILTNLQVFGDCHTTTKFIAKFVGRAIIVKDANCFHHFEDGVCSCGDSC